jgi:hypothetical protein
MLECFEAYFFFFVKVKIKEENGLFVAKHPHLSKKSLNPNTRELLKY